MIEKLIALGPAGTEGVEKIPGARLDSLDGVSILGRSP
jgi:hypothetical protein